MFEPQLAERPRSRAARSYSGEETMNPWTRAVSWLSFAAVMYLMLTDVVRPWTQLPALGDIGFTLVFVLFAIVHCAACAGWKKTGLFFALAAVVSYLLEETGVRTGWIYGAYHYSGMLGHVPVLIPLAWFMMIYPSWIVARALTRGLETRSAAGLVVQALIAAMVMTAWTPLWTPVWRLPATGFGNTADPISASPFRTTWAGCSQRSSSIWERGSFGGLSGRHQNYRKPLPLFPSSLMRFRLFPTWCRAAYLRYRWWQSLQWECLPCCR